MIVFLIIFTGLLYLIYLSYFEGFKTRKVGGRTGNIIYEYAFALLKSLDLGQPFESDLKMIPPFEEAPRKIKIIEPKNLTDFRIIADSLTDEPERTFLKNPYDIRLYQSYRDTLKFFLLNGKTYPIIYDVVVHIRLEDIVDNNHNGYTILPISFYQEVFKNILKRNPNIKNVLLVTKATDDFQRKYINSLTDYLKSINLFPKVQCGKVEDDMTVFLQTPIIVMSVGTFCFWPTFLSENAKEIHIPLYGNNITYMKLDKWESIYVKLFKYPIDLKRKLKSKDLDKIFDTEVKLSDSPLLSCS